MASDLCPASLRGGRPGLAAASHAEAGRHSEPEPFCSMLRELVMGAMEDWRIRDRATRSNARELAIVSWEIGRSGASAASLVEVASESERDRSPKTRPTVGILARRPR